MSHFHTREPPLKPKVAHLACHFFIQEHPHLKSGSSSKPFSHPETSFPAEVAHCVSHFHTREPPLKPKVAHLVCHFFIQEHPHLKSGSSSEPFSHPETSFPADVAHCVSHLFNIHSPCPKYPFSPSEHNSICFGRPFLYTMKQRIFRRRTCTQVH